MSIRSLVGFVLACGLLMASSQAVSGDGSSLVVVGTIRSYKQLHDNIAEGAIVPPTYEVEIGGVQVVEGESDEFPDSVSIRLDAWHLSDLVGQQIFVRLASKDDRSAMMWDEVHRVLCIPPRAVDAGYAEAYFDDPWHRGEGEQAKCRFVRGRSIAPRSQPESAGQDED